MRSFGTIILDVFEQKKTEIEKKNIRKPVHAQKSVLRFYPT